MILTVGLPLTTAGWPHAVLAEEPAAISTRVEVGYEGKARAGFWIPVMVELENQGPDFEGEVRVSDPSGAARQPGPVYQSRYVADVVLPRGSHKRVTIYVPYLSAVPRLEVNLVARGKTVASIEPAVSVVGEKDLLVGVIGPRASAWNLLTTLALPVQGSRVAVVFLTAAGFPERPEVLEAFDIIALGDARAEALSPGSLEALEGWVAGGGTLVLTGGANGKSNLKGLPGSLLPVIPGDAVPLESVPVLERIGSAPLAASSAPTITESRNASGRVLVQAGDAPLAVLGNFGNGRVLFLAFDPAAQPLAGWNGMPQVWKELLFQSLPPSTLSGSQFVRGGPYGNAPQWLYNLSNAVSNLTALEFPSINLLVGLIAGYVLLVGPVSYFVLRRLRRPGLAWATIPALVLLFSGGAYFLAFQTKGNDVQVSAATIVETAPGTGWARVRQMVGVFAPSEASYRVDLPGRLLAGSWNTGASGPATGGDVSSVIRHRESGSEAELLRMGMWTMRSLWTDGMQRVESGLSPGLYIEGDHLKGTVTNRGAIALKDTWLVAGGVLENLGALEPGAAATVDVPLAAAPAGTFYIDAQMFYGGNPPPADPAERRLWQQRLQVLSAALDSRNADLPSGVSALLVGWSDDSPLEIAVNEARPLGPSMIVFIEPVMPEVRGAFSLPAGLLTGQIVNVDAAVIEEGPGLFVLSGEDVTYQFDLPPGTDVLDRAAVQVPFLGGSSRIRDIRLLAYHWGNGTWDPLDVTTVSLQSQPGSPPVKTQIVPVPVPPPPGVVTGPGAVTVITPPYYRGIIFNEALESELPPAALPGYISGSGAVRVKLVVEGGSTVQIGTPSLVARGVAGE
ncbi:MAG: hypothetical protein HYX96_00175 [Chloroflexi bacterium]|nr:hypothetical protein [Chloroflexota bacterium]